MKIINQSRLRCYSIFSYASLYFCNFLFFLVTRGCANVSACSCNPTGNRFEFNFNLFNEKGGAKKEGEATRASVKVEIKDSITVQRQMK